MGMVMITVGTVARVVMAMVMGVMVATVAMTMIRIGSSRKTETTTSMIAELTMEEAMERKMKAATRLRHNETWLGLWKNIDAVKLLRQGKNPLTRRHASKSDHTKPNKLSRKSKDRSRQRRLGASSFSGPGRRLG
jgi:hypothetical protein